MLTSPHLSSAQLLNCTELWALDSYSVFHVSKVFCNHLLTFGPFRVGWEVVLYYAWQREEKIPVFIPSKSTVYKLYIIIILKKCSDSSFASRFMSFLF